MNDITKIKLLPHLGEIDDRNITLSKLSGSIHTNIDGFKIPRNPKLPIKNQFDSMMCVGFSHTAMIENALNLDYELSQYMVYHNRDLDKFEEFPFPGWYNDLAEKHLKVEGVCKLSSYNNFKEVPDALEDFKKVKASLLKEAAEYKILGYCELKSIDEIKQFIDTQNTATQNAGVVISIAVYPNFAEIGSDGIFPSPKGEIQGYHSIAVSGLVNDYLEVQNSIGEEWGDAGYGYISVKDAGIIQEIRGIIMSKDKEIQDIKPEPTKVLYRVQLSACKNRDYAVEDQNKLAKTKLTKAQKNKLGLLNDYLGSCLIYENGFYKCQVGSFQNKENAIKLQEVLKELGYEDAWITKYIK